MMTTDESRNDMYANDEDEDDKDGGGDGLVMDLIGSSEMLYLVFEGSYDVQVLNHVLPPPR